MKVDKPHEAADNYLDTYLLLSLLDSDLLSPLHLSSPLR